MIITIVYLNHSKFNIYGPIWFPIAIQSYKVPQDHLCSPIQSPIAVGDRIGPYIFFCTHFSWSFNGFTCTLIAINKESLLHLFTYHTSAN